jgi:hypothetical protein
LKTDTLPKQSDNGSEKSAELSENGSRHKSKN